MKRFFIIAAICISISAYAQPTITKDQADYCVDLKDGILVLTEHELTVEGDVLLNDSSIISKNGVISRKNGEKISLRSGQCVDQDGNIHMIVDPKLNNKDTEKKKKE